MSRFALLCAALVVLAACMGDPEPREPTGSPPTSSATPPPLPDQAKEDSPEGATTFVGYFVDLVNYTARTGDSKELDTLTRGCKNCEQPLTTVKEIRDDRQRIRFDLWELHSVEWADTSADQGVADVTSHGEEGDKRFRLALVLTPTPPYKVVDMFRPTK